VEQKIIIFVEDALRPRKWAADRHPLVMRRLAQRANKQR